MAVYKTMQRQILLDFLAAHKGSSFTVRDIVSMLAEAGTEPLPSESTVYRLMRELADDGTVRKEVNALSRENVYLLAEPGSGGVSMRCRICGNVYSVGGESEKRIKDEISRCGAAMPEDNIEFIIKCRKCK